MKKDIQIRKVKDIGVAILPPEDGNEEAQWEVYLLNLKDAAIENVLVSSRGYGKIEDEEVNTSVLRHFFERIDPQSYTKVELISPEVFPLNNEYWVSFSFDNFLFDQKYTFVRDSISAKMFTEIPLLGRKGVMIGN
ncbi:hypothetical protein [Pontibacter sp. G13]|uniref:hypothetical protein n=1 Tax=Pontibacter sp. G13 TaxID=3074898 RepID=UPI0028898F72|nr:hypothetical protein [Pontibacter sp. G13]WNJ16812.1 hypothetical protein RJD25_18265 [Pontibacter sp. G13]